MVRPSPVQSLVRSSELIPLHLDAGRDPEPMPRGQQHHGGFAVELAASFVNRSNRLKLWEKTETCEASASGAYGPKNVEITHIPIPYAAMEPHHLSDRSTAV